MEETNKEKEVIPTTFVFRNRRWECFYCGKELNPDNEKEHECPNRLRVGDNYDSNLEE